MQHCNKIKTLHASFLFYFILLVRRALVSTSLRKEIACQHTSPTIYTGWPKTGRTVLGGLYIIQLANLLQCICAKNYAVGCQRTKLCKNNNEQLTFLGHPVHGILKLDQGSSKYTYLAACKIVFSLPQENTFYYGFIYDYCCCYCYFLNVGDNGNWTTRLCDIFMMIVDT